MNMTFHMPVQVHYGAGCISACAGSFGKYGKRAIVITDPISFTATGAELQGSQMKLWLRTIFKIRGFR